MPNALLTPPQFAPLALIQSVENLAKARILIIGDVMMDAYLMGDADRISPEAPVPVVTIEGEKLLVGGAGNVARNITSLGGKARLIGVRGSDVTGDALETCLADEGIDATMLTLPHRPTTLKTRILAREQQVLRFDREDASPFKEDETLQILALIEEHIPNYDAVVISDYGKGLVSTQLMQGLYTAMEKNKKKLPVLVDPKPKNISVYQGVTLLTPNAKETSESAQLPVKTPQEVILAGQEIMKKLHCAHLLTTLGPLGMAVFQNKTEVWHIPTVARHVFDVTGAGDTVIAAASMGLGIGLSLVESCLLANYAAGIVVGEVGAATVTPNQLAETIATSPKPQIAQWA